jgi:hypothetical protein
LIANATALLRWGSAVGFFARSPRRRRFSPSFAADNPATIQIPITPDEGAPPRASNLGVGQSVRKNA